MNFLKGFLGGIVFAVLSTVLIAYFADGMSPFETVAFLTNHPAKITGLVQLLLGFGFTLGIIVQLLSYLAKRNTERIEKDAEQRETNRLMREYLARKLREENE